ncbi:uncharacterized protein LOC105698913 [Orussus abietinus]|uniref:uncharacterized protein LOC105698913 n=1 Tax=Orussus abietinus TaxID=222816 RepID=UPI0006266652|nr:uncharacterized protein LOC105698913 [Orussus abietinus]
MDPTGPTRCSKQISAQRRFFQWAVKWFYTEYVEDTSIKPDVPTLACLLKATGFQLIQYEKQNDHLEDERPKMDSIRITIECGTSNMKAILEMNDVKCQCPAHENANDGSFWCISGLGPAVSTDSINKVEETGSTLLPQVPKEINGIIRDISFRLFKMINNKSDVNQNSESDLNLSAIGDSAKSKVPEIKDLGIFRHHTQPELNTSRSLDALNTIGKEAVKVSQNEKSMKELPSRMSRSSPELHKPKDASYTKVEASENKIPDIVIIGSSPSLPIRKPLLKQATYGIDVDTQSMDSEPRASPPKMCSSPVLNELCNSLDQISMHNDEENVILAKFLLRAHQNMEKAMKMLLNRIPNLDVSIQDSDVFDKPMPLRSSSFRVSPSDTESRSGSSCSVPNQPTNILSTMQKPTPRRSISGNALKTAQKPTPTTPKLLSLRRRSFGNPSTSAFAKFSIPATNASKTANTLMLPAKKSANERVSLTAERRVSPELKPNLSRTYNPDETINLSLLKAPAKVPRALNVSVKPKSSTPVTSGTPRHSTVSKPYVGTPRPSLQISRSHGEPKSSTSTGTSKPAPTAPSKYGFGRKKP